MYSEEYDADTHFLTEDFPILTSGSENVHDFTIPRDAFPLSACGDSNDPGASDSSVSHASDASHTRKRHDSSTLRDALPLNAFVDSNDLDVGLFCFTS